MNTITVQLTDKQFDDLLKLFPYAQNALTEEYSLTGDGEYDTLRDAADEIEEALCSSKTYLWSSGCGRLELEIAASHVEAIAVSGDNEPACREAIENDGYLRRQLEELNMDLEVAVNFLTEAGIENAAEKDNDELRLYILWVACWDIHEERNMGN